MTSYGTVEFFSVEMFGDHINVSYQIGEVLPFPLFICSFLFFLYHFHFWNSYNVRIVYLVLFIHSFPFFITFIFGTPIRYVLRIFSHLMVSYKFLGFCLSLYFYRTPFKFCSSINNFYCLVFKITNSCLSLNKSTLETL